MGQQLPEQHSKIPEKKNEMIEVPITSRDRYPVQKAFMWHHEELLINISTFPTSTCLEHSVFAILGYPL